MRLYWPWAKRAHNHWTLPFKYRVCAGCGHLVLYGHRRNKQVEEVSHEKGFTATRILTYGEGCAPPYDKVEIGLEVSPIDPGRVVWDKEIESPQEPPDA